LALETTAETPPLRAPTRNFANHGFSNTHNFPFEIGSAAALFFFYFSALNLRMYIKM
jgi:hypothetical protein